MHVRSLIPFVAFATLFAAPVTAVAQIGGPVTPQGGQPPKARDGHATGVIRPPRHVDPGINQTPPPSVGHGTDPMPVIRPPDAPAGKGAVIPK